MRRAGVMAMGKMGIAVAESAVGSDVRFVVVGKNTDRMRAIASRLEAICPTSQVLTVQGTCEGLTAQRPDFIVALLDEDPFILSGVATLLSELPWMQAVFVCGASQWIEAEAIASMGFKFVVASERLLSWLEVALTPIVAAIRLKRTLAHFENQIPPAPKVAAPPQRMPMPVAEQRFREAYLRMVVASTPSHKHAAALAGIPYTTLRSMLDKLMLRGPPG